MFQWPKKVGITKMIPVRAVQKLTFSVKEVEGTPKDDMGVKKSPIFIQHSLWTALMLLLNHILRPHESANDAVGYIECLPYFLRHSAVRTAAAKKIGKTIDMTK